VVGIGSESLIHASPRAQKPNAQLKGIAFEFVVVPLSICSASMVWSPSFFLLFMSS